MSRIEAALRRAAQDLTVAGRRWAVVGGLAVGARTEPRFTRDVDVAVAVTGDADAEALIHFLGDRGYRALASVEQVAAGRLATVRLAPPEVTEKGLLLDLLFASSGIEAEVVAAAEAKELAHGLLVPVARLEHLLALKMLALDDRRRPQDRVDVVALLRHSTPEEVEGARRAMQLIEERGFHRGRDLTAEFARLRTELGPLDPPGSLTG